MNEKKGKSQLTRLSVANKLREQLEFSGKPKKKLRKALKLIDKVTTEFVSIGLDQKQALLIMNSKLFYIDYYDLLRRGFDELTSLRIIHILTKFNCIAEYEKDFFFFNYLSSFMIPSELMVNIKNDAKDRRLNYRSFDIYRMRNYFDWSDRFEKNYYISSFLNSEEMTDIIKNFKEIYEVQEPLDNINNFK